MAQKYGCSIKTIQRRIDKVEIPANNQVLRKVIILMDTTYWGMNLSVMLSKDAKAKKNLL